MSTEIMPGKPGIAPDSDEMHYAWILGDIGENRRLSSETLSFPSTEKARFRWIHLDYTRPGVEEWLRDQSGLTTLVVEALMQDETRPRCVSIGSGMMIFLRGVNLNPGANPEDMVSLRIWIDDAQIITLSKRRLATIKYMDTLVASNKKHKVTGDFLVGVINGILDRASIVIDEIADQVDELENQIMDTADQALREQITLIRQQSTSLRRFLAPQRDALNLLGLEKKTYISDENLLYLREESDRLTRLIEELDTGRDRLGILHELLINKLTEVTNQRMYVLSVIAAIFLPLSFLTGLLGINVGGIPGADSQIGFIVVLLLSAVAGGGLWVFFRSRGWF